MKKNELVTIGSKKAFNGWKLITEDQCLSVSEAVAKILIKLGLPLQG